MSAILPLEAEPYIDRSSVVQTLRNLTEAVGRGELPVSVVATFAKIAEKGSDPRFAKTRPVPLRMREMIEANPDLPPRQVVYRGLEEGLWTWEDVERFEANAEALSQARKKPASRGVYLTRNRRTRGKLPKTGNMFVPKMALDAVCSRDLCDGAKACLSVLMTLCGKAETVVTYTSSIATTLGRTARTVRNYFVALERAGLIERTAGRHPNTVKIRITALCRPEPYKEPDDIKAFRLARKSANPVIRDMADAVVLASWRVYRDLFPEEGRRKEISAFNPESESYAPVSPAKTVPASYARPSMSPPTSHSSLYRHPGLPPSAKAHARWLSGTFATTPPSGNGIHGFGEERKALSSASSSSFEKMALAVK